MDTVNYWMVSDLLEPGINVEVTLTAIARLAMALFLGWVNFVMLNSLDSPVEVWINMTALAFISQLGEDVLSVARRGVFGDTIGKFMVKLNYQLTFTSEYPRWFTTIHVFTILGCVAFIGFFAA